MTIRPRSGRSSALVVPHGAKVIGRVHRGSTTVEAYQSGSTYYYVSHVKNKQSTLFVVQIPNSAQTASRPASGGSVLGIPIPLPAPLASAVSSLVRSVLSGGAVGMATMSRTPYLPIGFGFVLVVLGALARRFSVRAVAA